MKGRLPHGLGEHLLEATGLKPGTPAAHALTYPDFDAAPRNGQVGGFAHMATLVQRLKARRPAAPARCCWTVATPGRAAAPRCGLGARTWCALED